MKRTSENIMLNWKLACNASNNIEIYFQKLNESYIINKLTATVLLRIPL